MFNINDYSPDNLNRILKVLKIISDEVGLQRNRSIKTIIIPPNQLEAVGIYKEQFLSILREFNKGTGIFRILNDLPNSGKMGLGDNIIFQVRSTDALDELVREAESQNDFLPGGGGNNKDDGIKQISYPLHLDYSGSTLSILGTAISEAVPLVNPQSVDTGLLLNLIFKRCKGKPTSWHGLSKTLLLTGFEGDKKLENQVQAIMNNPAKLSRYFTGIGLKKPIRSLFIAKSNDDLGFRVRIATPDKDWNNLPNKDKRKIVKYLKNLANSRT